MGEELTYVRLDVADRRGSTVPTAANPVSFSVSGPGEIVATDAGDPTSHVPFWSPSLPAFGGLCSVIVRRTGPGKIVLRATSAGLGSAKIEL